MAAQRGWDSAAQLDGAIYRIRRTAEPCYYITSASVTKTGIRLGFDCELDPKSITAKNISAVREGDKKKEAGKQQPLGTISLADPKTIEIEIPGIEKEGVANRTDKKSGSVRVNPPISITVKLRAKDGTPIEQTIHATINSLPQ